MKALFAGSFDPFTVGHRSIVERALRMFDTVVIGVGRNEHKSGMWTSGQRVAAISSHYASERRVEVAEYSGLTVNYARSIGADVLLRSVRSVVDFEYERNLADVNRALTGIDTVVMISYPEYSYVSSSMVRELIHNGENASEYIVGPFPQINEK